MSKFWLKSDGLQAMGKIEEYSEEFKLIPDGALVDAMIDKFVTKENNWGEKVYTVTWKIINGEFKNRLVWQDIRAFNTDAEKPYIRDSAIELLLYLYRIFNLQAPNNEPTEEELCVFWDKTAQLKIKQTKPKEGGKIRNYVAYVTAPGGETTDPMNDDIPF